MATWRKLQTVVMFSVALTMPLLAPPVTVNAEENLQAEVVEEKKEHLPENSYTSRLREPRRSADVGDEPESDVAVTGLTPQHILDILMSKYRSKMHPQARMMFSDINEKDLQEMCGTSASLRCGQDVLLKLDDGEDVDEKCDLRKTFLECIDTSRKECRLMASNGLVPILPPKSDVSKTLRKVWRALWTSGGCVLGY